MNRTVSFENELVPLNNRIVSAVSTDGKTRQKRGFWTALAIKVGIFLVKSCWRCYRCFIGRCDWKNCCQWKYSHTWQFWVPLNSAVNTAENISFMDLFIYATADEVDAYVLQMFFLFCFLFCFSVFFCFFPSATKYETTVLGNGWTDFHETFPKR